MKTLYTLVRVLGGRRNSRVGLYLVVEAYSGVGVYLGVVRGGRIPRGILSSQAGVGLTCSRAPGPGRQRGSCSGNAAGCRALSDSHLLSPSALRCSSHSRTRSTVGPRHVSPVTTPVGGRGGGGGGGGMPRLVP